MTDISGFGFADDVAFARHLVENIGVAGVPGSSFYHDPRDGAQPGALHILQDRENRGRSRRAPRQAEKIIH